MVNLKQLVATMILCGAAAGARAEYGCTAGSEFEPRLCPLNLPRIGQITVRQNGGITSKAGPAANCAAFRLTQQQVRRFLTQAMAVHVNDAHYTLDRSRCFAAGELMFTDGRRGEWFIEQFRVGNVKIGAADAQLVYCPACRVRPFRW